MATLTKKVVPRRQRAAGILEPLQAPALKKISWLAHGFSTRGGGFSTCYGNRSLNLGFTKDDERQAVDRNREQFLRATGAAEGRKPWPLITLKQIHSDLIHVVQSPNPGVLVGDGLVTSLSEVALGILTADCFPVLLVDVKHRAVGAFHAGWRGTVKRIVSKGLGIMRHEYGTQPEDVRAAIGPGIQQCCYEVGEELQTQFESQFDYGHELFENVHTPDPIREKYPMLFLSARPPGHGHPDHKLHLDVMEANRRQLLAEGVMEKQITLLKHCTSCNTRRFFSHRAEKGKTGRMLAVVGIRDLE